MKARRQEARGTAVAAPERGGLARVAELGDAGDAGVDALRTGGEEDLRDERDAVCQPARVDVGEPVRDERLAAPRKATDAAAARVGDEEPRGGGVWEASEAVLQRATDPWKRRGADAGDGVRHLDHDTVRRLQDVDQIGLEGAAPREDGPAEVGGDADGGMDAQVPAEGGVTDAAPREGPGRVDRA